MVLSVVAAFVVGVILFQQMPLLPSVYWLLALLPLLLLLYKCIRVRLLAALLAGFVWAFIYALIHQPPMVPAPMLEQVVLAKGIVQGIPDHSIHRDRFYFQVEELRQGDKRLAGNWTFRLSWYSPPPELTAGERWLLPVRLKPVHGYRNPGSFDYEAWLYRRQVAYTGYVKAEGRRIDTGCCSVDILRQQLSRSIEHSPVSLRAAAILKALVVGDRSSLSMDDNKRFSATGTSHLIAISGLHIGMVAALVYFLVQGLWRLFPRLCSRLPAKIAAVPVAMLSATAYAALAGFSVPTQRALIMLLVAMLGLMLRRPAKASRIFALALLLVLIWDPYAVISAGFWLSFAAVGSILCLSSSEDKAYSWLWLQLGIFLLLTPILLWQNLPVSLLAPLVNLFAIPLFGFLIVPLSLLAVGLNIISPAWGVLPLQGVAWMLDKFLQLLAIVAEWSPSMNWHAIPLWGILTIAVLALGLLLVSLHKPRHPLLRLTPVGLLMLSVVWLHQYRAPPAVNQLRFSLLDVGQGLSAVFRTTNHSLIFDTGPKFPSGFNTGSSVLLPYLNSQGIAEVDRLVLSHSDIDHVGGAKALVLGVPVTEIWVGEQPGLGMSLNTKSCVAGQNWWWDGVQFEVLYPPEGLHQEGNNQSCVLKVSAGQHSVLITGDVELPGERWMLSHVPEKLASTIVVAAHHGSNSSSSADFIQATRPDYVLFSAGKNNRWGFPREQVVNRWLSVDALLLNTADTGAIEFELGGEEKPSPRLWISESGHYWHK